MDCIAEGLDYPVVVSSGSLQHRLLLRCTLYSPFISLPSPFPKPSLFSPLFLSFHLKLPSFCCFG